jgi:hypothetical protein
MIIVSTLLILASSPAELSTEVMRDMFIGTLTMEQGQPVLTRCDVGETRYRLHDAKNSSAVADFSKDPRPAYGEVIAAYTEDEGRPALEVIAIDNLTPGKSCHLRDALDAAERSASTELSPQPNTGNSKAAAPSDTAFVGHYYLSGVRETGSELLLRLDGSFDWFLSYGAVDQTAHGTWAREGKSIVLTTAPQSSDKPLFAFIEVEPWSAKAEDEMLRRERDAKAQDIRATCPFLTDSWVSAPSSSMPDETKPPPAELRQKAADALTNALSDRARVEALARDVMAQPASERAANSEAVMLVLQEWMQARYDAREASFNAGLGELKLDDPVLPAGCALPGPTATSTPAILAGGLGVRVYDLASHQGARGVEVTLGFADGHTKQISTAERGLAIIREPFATGVVKISLNADYAEGRGASFDIPATSKGIIHFSIDASQLTQPAFDSLELRIEGRALIPDQFGRGRYERQP